jgi:phospholipid/cholesterol/gamma-HCH transport system substrate-binding protein
MRLPRLRLTPGTWVKLIVFVIAGNVLIGILLLQFGKSPGQFFGIGRYNVIVKLPQTGGLFDTAYVTYRGYEVGRVKKVRLTNTGVEAVLALKSSGIKIPSDLKAEVHSQSAIGEQYIELIPRNGTSPPLHNGSVISLKNTSVPPEINTVLDDLVTGLKAIPHDGLKTVIDESYTAVGGLGPQLSTIISGLYKLANDAGDNLGSLTTLIDKAQPVLDSQSHTSAAVAAWASHLARVTTELQENDPAVAGILQNAGPALDEARKLFDRLGPTLPVAAANLVSVADVGQVFHDNIETLLVEAPLLVETLLGAILANMDTNQPIRGAFLSFNLNINLPPPCLTGFLPKRQERSMALEDYPQRPPGLLYCRTPQDSQNNVRGAKNLPCETKPWKRAPTVRLCESDKDYVPLNEGLQWKGDPNATLIGGEQGAVPQLPYGCTGQPQQGCLTESHLGTLDGGPQSGYVYDVNRPGEQSRFPGGGPGGDRPGSDRAGPGSLSGGSGSLSGGPSPLPGASGELSGGLGSAPPPAAAEYNPASGTYVGPDGKQYSKFDLAEAAPKDKAWQTLLLPPEG